MRKKINKLLFFESIVITLILIFSFFLRVFGTDRILDFHYDQGRDAQVVWDLTHSHKFFLIGPTTGLAGVFRGPFYYYLITPLYWLGNGNPVFPSVFLALITVVGVFLAYRLGKDMQDRETGIIAAVISGFSFNIIFSSRWLSNPTPMLFLSLILVWGMFRITEGKKWGWPLVAFSSGLSLFNFGSSGEFFYFPAIAVFLIWQWKNRPDLRNLFLSLFLFFLTFAPLVFFDFRHQHILLNNILATFGVESGSFGFPSWEFVMGRTSAYINIFAGKIFMNRGILENTFLVIAVISFFMFFPKIMKSARIKTIVLILISAVVGLYFYKGNYGILYDYYMTGYYLIFILLFAVVLGRVWKLKFFGKILIFVFLFIFLNNNLPPALGKISDTCNSETSICFENQKKAIDWIYEESDDRDFNVDVYVPPVIPHSYNYLFTWLGSTIYNRLPVDSRIELLYTLYEVDPPHPERLEAWLERQKGIGSVLREEKFGGITVQERRRIGEWEE